MLTPVSVPSGKTPIISIALFNVNRENHARSWYGALHPEPFHAARLQVFGGFISFSEKNFAINLFIKSYSIWAVHETISMPTKLLLII